MEITQPLPIVDEKVVSEEQTKKNIEALKKFLKMDMKSKEELMNLAPEELDVGITDIISMEDRVCMMIRDRGYALTIDMDTSEAEKVGVKYFIPKLCNEEMIRALKGIDKSSITPNGARGAFEAKTEEITSELFGFIEKVPTDGDMPRYNYEEMFEQMREEQKANEVNQQQEQIVEPKVQETKEEIIGSQKPIFSMDEAKEMAVGPNRIFSKIKDFQSKIASKLFNKEKEAPEMDKGDEISK